MRRRKKRSAEDYPRLEPHTCPWCGEVSDELVELVDEPPFPYVRRTRDPRACSCDEDRARAAADRGWSERS